PITRRQRRAKGPGASLQSASTGKPIRGSNQYKNFRQVQYTTVALEKLAEKKQRVTNANF
uniref:Uncharacterized protein n=1 Tax=Romanomermis culicivorax TaxID=13658 RepID=A0A915IMM5_ROMCU